MALSLSLELCEKVIFKEIITKLCKGKTNGLGVFLPFLHFSRRMFIKVQLVNPKSFRLLFIRLIANMLKTMILDTSKGTNFVKQLYC